MVHYRLSELDLSTRIMIALEMLKPIPEREWGRVTELAQIYDVSRTFLYDLRDRALDVLAEGLSPRKPGPQPQEESLTRELVCLSEYGTQALRLATQADFAIVHLSIGRPALYFDMSHTLFRKMMPSWTKVCPLGQTL
jgi:hypothetical protein